LKILETCLSIILSLPYILVLVALQVRLLLFGGDENANTPDYSVPFVGNLRRTLVLSTPHQKNGFVVGTFVKREPVRRMLLWIH
jgi:hypothetical protein